MITNTDHRSYFLDLQIQELFAHTPDEATPIHTRKLKTNIPKRKEKYINDITKKIQKLNLTKAESAYNKKQNLKEHGIKTSNTSTIKLTHKQLTQC